MPLNKSRFSLNFLQLISTNFLSSEIEHRNRINMTKNFALDTRVVTHTCSVPHHNFRFFTKTLNDSKTVRFNADSKDPSLWT